MPKISVIIPVYNTAKYLMECLDSVIAQTLEDLEIICVNDGSTDLSLEILKEFARKDSRIKLINQNNRGVSAARNAGLKIATGKYVGFVDSDDTVDAEFFKKLFTAAEEYKCGLVFSNSFNTDPVEKDKKYNILEILQIILPTYFQKDLYNCIWNKLYSNKIIKDNDLQFPLGLKLGEDAIFNLNFLEFTDQLYYLDYSGYNYREVSGSATRDVRGQEYLDNAIEVFSQNPSDFILKNIDQKEVHRLKSERFMNYVISLVYIYCKPKNKLSLKQKFIKLKKLVTNKTVSDIFTENIEQRSFIKGNYKKMIYHNIKNKNIILLYILALYSYYRNL